MAIKQSFVILPKDGLFALTSSVDGAKLMAMAQGMAQNTKLLTSIRMEGKDHNVKVLDSAAEHGAKLIEMDATAGADLARRQVEGDFRIFENKIYRPMSIRANDIRPTRSLTDGTAPTALCAAPPMPVGVAVTAEAVPSQGLMKIPFTVTDAKSGKPIEGATVMTFQNQAEGKGTTGVTDANGQCTNPWLKSLTTIEQLCVMPSSSNPTNWGYYAAAVPLQASFALAIEQVDPAYADCTRFYFPKSEFDPASGVTVGVIDTGVSAESALNLVGGANTVAGEDPADYGSNGDPHGTHVAGLVGARGLRQGNAPGVALRSYRVFGSGGGGATSFAIIKAVVTGVSDGCDVLNMSLGVDGEDLPLHEAIEHARGHGVLVVAAGNNSHGGPVGSPACYPESIGVSAIGRIDSMPAHAQPVSHITDIRGTDPNCFFADFSCVGPSLGLSGPGVGVISTIPGNLYGQMSGTSMACPLIAGFAANLLANTPHILLAHRDRARSDALCRALLAAAKSLGLAADEQGRGIPWVELRPQV